MYFKKVVIVRMERKNIFELMADTFDLSIEVDRIERLFDEESSIKRAGKVAELMTHL